MLSSDKPNILHGLPRQSVAVTPVTSNNHFRPVLIWRDLRNSEKNSALNPMNGLYIRFGRSLLNLSHFKKATPDHGFSPEWTLWMQVNDRGGYVARKNQQGWVAIGRFYRGR